MGALGWFSAAFDQLLLKSEIRSAELQGGQVSIESKTTSYLIDFK
jgi:hypothetical protein